jgi:hypothetical protein
MKNERFGSVMGAVSPIKGEATGPGLYRARIARVHMWSGSFPNRVGIAFAYGEEY